jgi:hypothetical protein
LPIETRLLSFSGLDADQIIYNPCPFIEDGNVKLLARAEAHASEVSHVYRFEKIDSQWNCKELKFLHVQDPTLCVVDGKRLVGGVALDVKTVVPGLYRIAGYRMRYFNFDSKESIFDGPEGMKGIRLIDLDSGVGVFTRPRREKWGTVSAAIHFDCVGGLEEVNAEKILAINDNPDTRLKEFFDLNEWGGVNALYQLEGGWIGVLGHIAEYVGNRNNKTVEGYRIRSYAAISFSFHPQKRIVEEPKLLLSREDIAHEATPKRSDLLSVVYPGGFIFGKDDNGATPFAHLFFGLSDAHVGVATVSYPFSKPLATTPNNDLFVLSEEIVKTSFLE